MCVYAVLDKYHPHINGDTTPEVRSDNAAFETVEDFFDWCRQHGAMDEIYKVS